MEKYSEITVHDRLEKTPDRVCCSQCGFVVDLKNELCIAYMFTRLMNHIYYTDHTLIYLKLEKEEKKNRC